MYVDRQGFHAIHVGALPPQCAMLTQVNSAIEEMAVNGSAQGDPTMIYHAIAHDPLTASVLSLAEIKTMVNELFTQNRKWLPRFKHFKV